MAAESTTRPPSGGESLSGAVSASASAEDGNPPRAMSSSLSRRAFAWLLSAVGVGFLGLVCLDVAYRVGTWYVPVCLEHNRKRSGGCEIYTPGTYDQCHAYEVAPPGDISCPSKWFVVPFVYVSFLCWLLLIGVTIRVWWLRRRGRRNNGDGVIKLRKWMGVTVAVMAAIFGLSSLCVFSFFVWMAATPKWCEDIGSDNSTEAFDPATCNDYDTMFQPAPLFLGGLFVGVAAVFSGFATKFLLDIAKVTSTARNAMVAEVGSQEHPGSHNLLANAREEVNRVYHEVEKGAKAAVEIIKS